MFDFLRSLFGGSQQQQQQQSASSQTSSGASEATSTPGNYNPFTAMFGGNIGNLISSLGGGAFGSFPSPSGPFAAPMSAGETSILSSLPTGYGSSAGAQSYLSDLLSGKFLPGGANFNGDTLNAAITAAQRPTLTGLNQVLSQDLPSQFIRSGQIVNPRAQAGSAPGSGTDTGSTAFDTAAGRAVNTAAQTISDIASTMSQNVYNTERQLQQGGVQLSQGELQSTISNLQAQSLPRMIQQYGIDQGTKVFQNTVSNVLDFLKTLGGIGGPSIANASQSMSRQLANATATSSGTGTDISTGNPFSSLFGGKDGGTSPFGNFLGLFR